MYSLDEVMDEQPTVTKREVMRELKRHSAEWADFVLDSGDHEEYNGAYVLAWLGY